MNFVNNEPEQIEIRKSQNTLIVVGSGIILFSVWTVIKFMGMLFLLRKETVEAILGITGPIDGMTEGMAFLGIVVVSVFLMAVIFSVRIYVGRCAIAEGRGKRRGWLYIVLAMVMIISSLSYFLTNFFTTEAPEQLGAFTRNQSLSALIIDATSVIMLSQMVISAIKIRKLRGTESKAGD